MNKKEDCDVIKKHRKSCFVGMCLSLFLALLFAGLFFRILLTDPVKNFKDNFPLIDFSRNFIDQEHYLVSIQPLRERIRKIVEESDAKSVSIYIEYLNTGANISINPDIYIWPASLTKVPLAMAVMKKIEKGEWKLDNELVLMNGDSNNRSGDSENPLAEYPIGTRFKIEKLLEELLIKSDNTAYYIFLRNLHQDDLKEVIQALGMETLFTQEGKISAKEYSRILRSLYTASFLSRFNSEKILEWLDASSFDNFLSLGIEKDIPFPHKYGEDDQFRAYSDSGIVYIPNRPFLISVMIQGDQDLTYETEQEKASEFMLEIARESYNFFSEAQN